MLPGWVIYAINRAQVRPSAARPTVYAAPLDAEVPPRQLGAAPQDLPSPQRASPGHVGAINIRIAKNSDNIGSLCQGRLIQENEDRKLTRNCG